MQQRLSVYFEDDFIPLEDVEPFTLGSLEQYQLRYELLEQWLKVPASPAELRWTSLPELLEIASARGILPLGNFGKYRYECLLQEAAKMAQEVQKYGKPLAEIFFGYGHLSTTTSAQEALASTFFVPGIQTSSNFKLHGKFSKVTEHGSLLIQASSKKAKHFIRFWCAHLLFNLLELPLETLPRQSILVCLDQTLVLAPFPRKEEALSALEALLQLYWKGLQEPLSFFPASSFAYAHNRFEGKSEEVAWFEAKKAWRGSFYAGEGENPYFKRCFAQGFPENAVFSELALTFWTPFLEKISSYDETLSTRTRSFTGDESD